MQIDKGSMINRVGPNALPRLEIILTRSLKTSKAEQIKEQTLQGGKYCFMGRTFFW